MFGISADRGTIVGRWGNVDTGDTLTPGRRQLGLGVEPMSCPPNGFQAGDGLIRLEPGQSVTTTWGVKFVPAPSSG